MNLYLIPYINMKTVHRKSGAAMATWFLYPLLKHSRSIDRLHLEVIRHQSFTSEVTYALTWRLFLVNMLTHFRLILEQSSPKSPFLSGRKTLLVFVLPQFLSVLTVLISSRNCLRSSDYKKPLSLLTFLKWCLCWSHRNLQKLACCMFCFVGCPVLYALPEW